MGRPEATERMSNGGSPIPPIPARPSLFESAAALPCFHGRLTNSEEDRIFKYYLDMRGAFLLRKSNSQHDVLVISIVVDRKNIYHIKLQQKHAKVCIIQSTEEFPTLISLINHFTKNPFPTARHKELYLTKAIPAKRSGDSPKPRAPSAAIAVEERRRMSASVDKRSSSIDERPRLPLPAPQGDPIYAESRHLYSRVEKTESDQLDHILRLCQEVDLEIQAMSRMKCSCGLYLEESQLIHGWMMHRDTEGETTKGRIFFLDTKNNASTWKLPADLGRELRSSYPEIWERVSRLMRDNTATSSDYEN